MENLLLCRLVNFLGQLVPLIRHLSEANMDLCVFCRNNNETFEMYTSHKVRCSFEEIRHIVTGRYTPAHCLWC